MNNRRPYWLKRARSAHQRAGLLVAPLLLVILVSGMLLNHADDLGLAQVRLPSWLARAAYGFKASPPRVGYRTAARWVSQGADVLYLDRFAFGTCAGMLRGVVAGDQDFAVLCDEHLSFYDRSGRLLEKLDFVPGPGEPPAALGTDGRAGILLLRSTSGDAWTLDAATLAWDRITGTARDVVWSTPDALPPELTKTLPATVPQEFHVERLLQDIHSGRLLGGVGAWLLDAIALAAVLLLGSGMAMWQSRR